MNAAGLRLILGTIHSVITTPSLYDDIVKEGVTPQELAGTRDMLSHLFKATQVTPPEKLDAVVAKYDARLTEYSDKFRGEWTANRLAGFRDAQSFAGFVNTVFNESGVRP